MYTKQNDTIGKSKTLVKDHEMLLNLLPRYQAKSVGGRPEETVTWKNVGKTSTVDLYIQCTSPSDWFVQHKRIYIAESSPKNVSRVLKQIDIKRSLNLPFNLV